MERPGQDSGFYSNQVGTKNMTFNSTSPRFTIDKEKADMPGPGSYESTHQQTFKDTIGGSSNTMANSQYSVFKDTTQRMDDVKGYRGQQKHANPTGPGEYNFKTPFLRKTFNTSLPLGKFV